jgi:hypothetical protein
MSLTIRSMNAATDLPGVAELYSHSNPEPISPEEILEWDARLVEGGQRHRLVAWSSTAEVCPRPPVMVSIALSSLHCALALPHRSTVV